MVPITLFLTGFATPSPTAKLCLFTIVNILKISEWSYVQNSCHDLPNKKFILTLLSTFCLISLEVNDEPPLSPPLSLSDLSLLPPWLPLCSLSSICRSLADVSTGLALPANKYHIIYLWQSINCPLPWIRMTLSAVARNAQYACQLFTLTAFSTF